MREYEIWAKTQAFKRKLERARAEFGRLRAIGKPVVAMSWGKDSCAMGHLALTELGAVDMMHMACAHELPGGELVNEYFKNRASIVHELAPINTLAESLAWLHEVGLPHERERYAHQKIIKVRKKDRGQEWAIANGYSITVMGMRAEEAKGRRLGFAARGLLYQRKSGHWTSNPIGWWTARDVWAYLVSRSVPWHPLYDRESLGFTRETLRNGGWLYTDGANDGWAAWMKVHYPEQWRRLVEEFPQMGVY